MFINCPFCKALIATDPASDLPPEHCPRCAAKLRGLQLDESAPAASTTPQGGETAATTTSTREPDFLLHVPPGAPLPEDSGAATPSELSSRIHQIVSPEAPATGPGAAAAIAPIATMLKHASDATEDADPAAVPPAAEPVQEAAPMAPPAETPPAPAGNATNAAAAPAGSGSGAVVAEAGTISAQATAGAPAKHDAATAESTIGAAPGTSGPSAAAIAASSPDPATPAHATQATARALPTFAQRRARLGASGLHWKALAVISALALLLVLQLLLADRAQLAADARWRPLLSNVCGVLGCALPPWREPAAFTVLARDVRPHPSTPGALRVSATFRNDARWPQPWPQLRLTLSDVNGNAVATRDFSARDYLGAKPTQAELDSGQSASIAMDIVEPESRSVAFDFDLH